MTWELKGLLPISLDLFVPNSSESVLHLDKSSGCLITSFWKPLFLAVLLHRSRHGLILTMLLTLNCLMNVTGWGPARLTKRSWRISRTVHFLFGFVAQISIIAGNWSFHSPNFTVLWLFSDQYPIPSQILAHRELKGFVRYAKANLRWQGWEACEVSQVSSMGQTNLGCGCVPWLYNPKKTWIQFHCQHETTSNPWLKAFKFDWLLS